MSVSGVSSATSAQQTSHPANYDQQIEALEKQIATFQDKVSDVDTDSQDSEQVTQQLQAQIQMLQAQLQQLQQQKAEAQTAQNIPAPKSDASAQNSASTATGGNVDVYA